MCMNSGAACPQSIIEAFESKFGVPVQGTYGLTEFPTAATIDIAVDVELVLATDVSSSIGDGELALQRGGYARALTDPRVLAAIQARRGD